MRFLFLIIFLGAFIVNHAQDTISTTVKKAKHYNLIKIGSSIQADIIPGYYDYNYDYYGGGYYNYRDADYYFEGYNAKVYVAYEHIWEYQNKSALAIEPMAGASFRENSTHAFIGNNVKFYWANRDIWRMGIALYTGYSYANHTTTIPVRKNNGSYYQMTDVKMHYHLFSTNVSIIPFQFRFRNVPLIIESQIGMIGVSILTERSEIYQTSDNEEQRISGTNAFPYLFKTELKIGFVLP